MAGKTRQSNIELLRILTICGVVVLHYNGNVAFSHVAQGSVNHQILLALEVLFICAVNLFVLITGYFSCTTNSRKAIKPLELLVQVVLLGAGKYLALAVLGGSFSLGSLVGAMIPNNYFVFLYVTLYLVSPYINVLLDKLSQKQHGVLVGLCLLLFSVWPTALDLVYAKTGMNFTGMYTTNTGGSQMGYSVLNFVLMYLLGAYLRRCEGKQWKTWALALSALACVGALFVWQMVDAQTARSYANPFVIATAVLVFCIFRRINLRSGMVNALAKGAFTCFLLHDALLPLVGIERAVAAHPAVMVGHILVTVPAIFLACWVVWKIYDTVTAPVFRWLGRKLSRLDDLLSIQ